MNNSSTNAQGKKKVNFFTFTIGGLAVLAVATFALLFSFIAVEPTGADDVRGMIAIGIGIVAGFLIFANMAAAPFVSANNKSLSASDSNKS